MLVQSVTNANASAGEKLHVFVCQVYVVTSAPGVLCLQHEPAGETLRSAEATARRLAVSGEDPKMGRAARRRPQMGRAAPCMRVSSVCLLVYALAGGRV